MEGLRSPLARRVELHGALGSTQDRARELVREGSGASHGTIVIAGVQTGGRGRRGRSWGSPAGGLWMSLVLRPELELGKLSRITPAAAVGVAKALNGLGAEARIKWPNDLLVGGKKICGVLAEAGFEPGPPRRPYVVLGVGLDANLDPGDLNVPDYGATTLRAELGRDVDPPELLRTLLDHLNFELERIEDFGAVLEDWRALDRTLGRDVRVRRTDEVLEGRAVGINSEGALILRTQDRTVELFEGDVERLGL